MIAVDTSALIAILRDEAEAPGLASVLGHADHRLISAGTLLELGLVTMRKGDEPERAAALLERAKIEVVPFSNAQALAGTAAFRQFGRGSGHPAQLNFGDCFAYALAKSRNLPLLFKGEDFARTDIVPALRPAQDAAR